MRLVLLGAPGAGKGTQAERLAARYSWPQVATGDIFRAAVANLTPLGVEAKRYMDAGDLVPDEVTERMIEERLAEPDCEGGFFLDGFPRSVHQARELDRFEGERGRRIDLVVDIEADPELLFKRIAGRRMCRGSGHICNVFFEAPEVEGRCDECGGELYQRDDDNEETVRRRLEVYESQTAPVLAYYEPSGRVVTVDGSASADEVFGLVVEAVDAAAGASK